MDFYILDKDFNRLYPVDAYETIIWTDKYWQEGDFELHVPVNDPIGKLLAVAEPDEYYLECTDSEHIMCVEHCETEISQDDKLFKISGRSLESILDRRCIWKQTVISGNLQSAIKKLLDENVIVPNDSLRKMPMRFAASTDAAITSVSIDEKQYTGDYLGESIKGLCKANGVGYMITVEDGVMVFALYSGVDHSEEQTKNHFVTFSPEFDNLVSSEYGKDMTEYKNVARIAGEGEGSERVMVTAGEISGIARRELYVDARDLSQTVDSVKMSDNAYKAQLIQRGEEKLAENVITEAMEAEVDTTGQYEFGVDYFLGDIVQQANEYQIDKPARVTEVIRAIKKSGTTTVPTFEDVGGSK